MSLVVSALAEPATRRATLAVLGLAGLASLLVPGRAALAQDAASGAAPLLSPEALEAELAASDPVLINVHVPYDGEIEGTDAFIPFDAIAEDPSLLPADLGARVVVYCRTGRMSAIAGAALVAMGYSDVADLEGGMEAWTASGRPLVRREAG